MPTVTLENAEQGAALGRRLSTLSRYPVTVTWREGKLRTSKQNRLIHRWFTDIARQTEGETPLEIKRFCKLHFGAPILATEDEAFCALFAAIPSLPYAAQLLTMDCIELTSAMDEKQMGQMMDAMQAHYRAVGIHLTEPPPKRLK